MEAFKTRLMQECDVDTEEEAVASIDSIKRCR